MVTRSCSPFTRAVRVESLVRAQSIPRKNELAQHGFDLASDEGKRGQVRFLQKPDLTPFLLSLCNYCTFRKITGFVNKGGIVS